MRLKSPAAWQTVKEFPHSVPARTQQTQHTHKHTLADNPVARHTHTHTRSTIGKFCNKLENYLKSIAANAIIETHLQLQLPLSLYFSSHH